MIGVCCKRLQSLLLPSCRNVNDSVTHLRLSQKDAIFIIRSSYSSLKSLLAAEIHKPRDKGGSFTVSYLINSCGLSPEIALSVSKKVHFDTREGPDSVLGLLKHHGLNDTHISGIVRKCPKLFLCNAEKTLLPKLEFLGSIGISGPVLAQLLVVHPSILQQSLERSIIPCYDIVKNLHLLDNVKVAQFLMNTRWVLKANVVSNIAPNIALLRALQVAEGSMSLCVARHPFVMSLETDKFKENVNKVVSMGIRPSSATFFKALHVIALVDASKWAQKMEYCRKCGWSEDDFLLAFRKNPGFMILLEKKFSSKMDFLVNKMGWQPADVAGTPGVLNYSLEKWIKRRCSVIRILLLKGFIAKEELSLGTIVNSHKGYFLDRFVFRYQEQVPELLSVLQGKLDLVELGFRFEGRSGAMNQL